MGCWWINESPYPGPASSPGFAEIAQAFSTGITQACLPLKSWGHRNIVVSRRLYKQLVAAGIIYDEPSSKFQIVSSNHVPAKPRDKLPPKKIQPTVNHVGPRPRRQFDRRGRAKY